MSKVVSFFYGNIVLSISILLAIVSSIFVSPDAGDIAGYIDFRTLSILLSLIIVMEGYKKLGVFDELAQDMLSHVKNIRQLILLLVMMCFFFSMGITNDVALITFVPFTIVVLSMLGEAAKRRWMVPTVVMQTIAANLGSMLTPVGNPQNLYLSGKAHMDATDFVLSMLPLTAVAFLLLTLWIWIKCGKNRENIELNFTGKRIHGSAYKVAAYTMLFLLCLLAVANLLNYWIVLLVVLASVLLLDRKLLKEIDYSLIFTFIALFIFIGNIGELRSFSLFLRDIMRGHEMLTAVAVGQLISNVPAALLLSGFTKNYSALIIGTNIGGLGTLIASMASLISFKYVANEDKNVCTKYILYFTAANLIFLLILLACAYFLY